MQKKLTITLTLAAVGCMCLLAADVDKFLKASDGEVIGVLELGKEKLSISGTIKEVTWAATNGQYIVLKWDGKTLGFGGSVTNVVNTLVTDGTFCRVRGHAWGAHGHYTLEHMPSRIGCRQCMVCGLHQEQYATEWK